MEEETPSLFFEVEGREYCDKEAAAAKLLTDGVCYLLYAKTQDDPPRQVLGLYVNCNDLFYWACADAEPVDEDQIGPLLKRHLADPRWGSIKWACQQRQMQPQRPMVELMKKEGGWDAELEALPEAPPS